ncbi:hypothetical protein BDU57DRAFT_514885 [Ampelomyces quisqualis]|uniref:Uncharacterized protein n=1 Tax=Ampelomyces quisqualis TaxID=50730 RepID=A0A6A5QRC7_AMPQU|nr:hypothetical protein BDU57DRAFT_514885 [Ampelomyces quisqualis]
MSSFTTKQEIAFTHRPCSRQRFDHMRTRSDASTATSSPTGVNTATTSVSTYSTSSTNASSHLKFKQQPYQSAMSVYYQYDENGALQATLTHGTPREGSIHPHVDYYLERGDTVGAYLAQRAMTSYGHIAEDAFHVVPQREESMYHWQPEFYETWQAGETDDSFEVQGGRYCGHPSIVGDNNPAWHASPPFRYPDPEDIRHLHTIYSLLPWIDTARRFRALEGPAVDIVENETNFVFAHDLPKKMLVLYFGRRKVSEFIRTLGPRRDEQFEKCRGRQILVIPRGVSSTAAFRVLASWMSRASQQYCMGSMRQFRVPQNTYAACTLAQTLTLFGLHKDARRVDEFIAREHFRRPIFAVELETLWNSLGGGNRYTYAMIKIVADRLRVYEVGASKKFPMLEEMLQLLERYPQLKARVRDPNLNEMCRPIFSGEWCRSMGIPSREGRANESPGRTLNETVTVQEDGGGAPQQMMEPGPSEKPKIRTRMAAVLRIVPANESRPREDANCNQMAE